MTTKLLVVLNLSVQDHYFLCCYNFVTWQTNHILVSVLCRSVFASKYHGSKRVTGASCVYTMPVTDCESVARTAPLWYTVVHAYLPTFGVLLYVLRLVCIYKQRYLFLFYLWSYVVWNLDLKELLISTASKLEKLPTCSYAIGIVLILIYTYNRIPTEFINCTDSAEKIEDFCHKSHKRISVQLIVEIFGQL